MTGTRHLEWGVKQVEERIKEQDEANKADLAAYKEELKEELRRFRAEQSDKLEHYKNRLYGRLVPLHEEWHLAREKLKDHVTLQSLYNTYRRKDGKDKK
jgi:hypothetical protein